MARYYVGEISKCSGEDSGIAFRTVAEAMEAAWPNPGSKIKVARGHVEGKDLTDAANGDFS